MSLSVNGSNSPNPFALLQSLWQQNTSANGTQSQSDPLSSLLAALGQQDSASATAANATTATTSSGSGVTAPSGATSPQFGPQTLEALLALQANGSGSQSLASQFANATGGLDPGGSQQASQSQGGHHHHHHHMGSGGGSGGMGGIQNFMNMLAGATSQTTANANGSTTTSISYADGSSVSMTSAASGTSTASDSTTASAGGASVSGNNLLEQLIQMQAQLVAPAATQSVTA